MITRRSFLSASLCLLLLASAAPAQRGRKAPPPSAADILKGKIEAALSNADAARAHWGIEVVSLDTGKTVYAQNEHKLFMPASNTKLFTTALALTTLGPQFRFHTTVEAAAAADKHGRITGDLFLVGRGDPNLSDRALPYTVGNERQGTPLQTLDALADEVARQGIKYVDGDVAADDTYFVFENVGQGWGYGDVVWAYGAPVSALTINDNVLSLEVLSGQKTGDPALIKLEPFHDYYRIDNRVKTTPAVEGGSTPRGRARDAEAEGGPARRISIDRQPGSFTLEVWGAIPENDPGFHQQVAIEDPALFAGRYLREALIQRGIRVSGQVRVEHAYRWQFDDISKPAPSDPARVVLAAHNSAPLAEDLKVTAKVSQNLHAEILLRTVARERRGIGSVRAGLDELKAMLDKAGASPQEYVFNDGSGLSRQNLVSPATVVALLQFMDKQTDAELWHGILPLAGVDGTLNSRMRDTPAAGRIQAKTGTLSHVAALSGYATTAKGERVVFSIFVNNHNLPTRAAEGIIDRVALAITEME